MKKSNKDIRYLKFSNRKKEKKKYQYPVSNIQYKKYQKQILYTLKYFSFFNYPPTFKEIYTFLPKKISKITFKKALLDLELKKKIKKIDIRYLIFDKSNKYTPLEYSIKEVQSSKLKIQNYRKRFIISQNKLKNWKFNLYLKFLSFFPQIKLVGLSGSLAMMNAKKEDDVDLFIITAKNRLFTGRFIAVVLAELLGIRRRRDNIRYTFHVPRYTDKVCLNLFFDESDLTVPDFKKTEYIAHEILQMKPLLSKEDVYNQFLKANFWVYEILPNANLSNLKFKIKSSKSQSKVKNYLKNFKFLTAIFNLIADKIEEILKILQLYFIKRHKTSEIITETQLWFHPEDFEKKIKLL